MEIKTVGILHHPRLPESLITASLLAERLSKFGASPWLASVRDEEAIAHQVPGLDLLVTLGGDGTILRAARKAASGWRTGSCCRLPPFTMKAAAN
jgi:NAD kinase